MADAENDFQQLYKETLKKMDGLTDKQKRILQAALELFSTQGFSETSSAQIADRAGVAVGSVYQRFHNKQALLVAVLAPLLNDVLPKAVDEFGNTAFSKSYDEVEPFVRAIVPDRLRFIDQNYAALKLLAGQVIVEDEGIISQLTEAFSSHISSNVIPNIKHLQKTGKMARFPERYVIQFLFSSVIGYFGKRILGIPVNIEDEIKYMTVFLTNGLTDHNVK
ncbi:TetR/AcrR family transcriptional regulator [Lentilactobacillus buchneri]|uniref:Transcriptional regulator, TetR family n=1 Tax=Lentilactobacillus buchneri subsp. silagei CD034 TaxID=1071400 RepID=J9VXD8_LENBU|nr:MULTISPECIES: helix-turn-helix domain-containing protein [Lentilactobacillus]MCC6100628.1 TetR/AcrR family transcriptional regulator [Lactobacillus sp.]AFR99132.1 Transcriptional regulator, TetR family [Lentilactobacillus buchneri subsp. silagei CD034]MCT2901179.1 TetR/AcrR family transcriptional regulator [Lentilactobacillus buchneri]MCT3543670.1 TetR/AcrR family transcriptional regulator [Lentilactobacillus buchneri]MCT3545728.1 TetR/AcrR family transcriptional regulator [Lentilactobacill